MPGHSVELYGIAGIKIAKGCVFFQAMPETGRDTKKSFKRNRGEVQNPTTKLTARTEAGGS